ncbi:DUF1746-domain-containing protein [Nemania sp. FL0916]|nr:DUF1746-domain-containing protein [Nemania sp. FL0916]
MNHDPSPTSPADRPLLPTQQHHQHHHHRHDEADNDTQRSSPSSALDTQQHGSANPQSPSLSPAAKESLNKKLEFLMQLSLNLDTLAYAELCILYYMDCSFFRLFIRWMAQTLFVSPKSEDTVLVVPNYHVSAIVAPNLLCMFLHLIAAPTEAGEASRGYLHGGVLVDFIGQKAPSSRFTLILLDAVVLAVQCFMITVNIEKEKIRKVIAPRRVTATTTTTANSGGVGLVPATTTNSNTNQDLDAEERGVLRDAPEIDDINETSDIEMRPLGRNNIGGLDGHVSSAEMGSRRPGQSGIQASGQFEGLVDILRSGNGVIGSFHIPHSLRTAWHSREDTTPGGAAAYALQNVGYNATLAALAAQRRARLSAAQPRQS